MEENKKEDELKSLNEEMRLIKNEIKEISDSLIHIRKLAEDTANIVCARYKPFNSLDGEVYATNVEKEMWIAAGRTSAEYALKHMYKAKTLNGHLSLLDYAISQSGSGLFLEFGVFTGSTINFIAEKTDEIVYGFDSFEGLPETWRSGYEAGMFKCSELPRVLENVRLIKGWFEESLPVFLEQHSKEKVAFIHIDCDLYSSTACIFKELSNIQAGTIIVFDEFFNYPSWEKNEAKAFEEFIDREGWDYEFIGYVPSHQQAAVRIKEKKQQGS